LCEDRGLEVLSRPQDKLFTFTLINPFQTLFMNFGKVRSPLGLTEDIFLKFEWVMEILKASPSPLQLLKGCLS
jgi:hypothetical protein